jgi:hypothetical protein
MLLWYNFIVALLVFGVLLLLWCSNIIATISSALLLCPAVLALWVSAARIWFHQCAQV